MKTKVISVLTKLTIMVFFTVYLTGCKKKAEKVSSVSLDNTSLKLEEGKSATLKATVLPAGADNKKVTWKSDNSNIVSVDQKGTVTAVKAGSTTITVITADGGKTASCTVTVTAKPKEDVKVDGVTITATPVGTDLEVGSKLAVTAEVSPEDANDRDVTWSGYDADANPPGSIKASDDKVIATYTMENDTITVTGVAPGSGTLTVTTKDGNHSDTLKITVVAKTDATIAVTAVTLDPSADFDLQTGEKANLMATVEPNNATDKTLTWTSGDEAIVTVDNGVVIGVAVGGPIEITVTTSDPSIFATLKVTVKANVSVTGVTVDPEEKTDLKVDETFEVMAIVKPFGSLQTVTWSGYDATATPPTGSIKASNNDAIVIATYTMGTDGKLTVTGKAVGEGKLIVTTTDVNHSDTLNITVVGTGTSPIVTISLPNGVANATLTAVGETLQLSASVDPVVDGATFTWESSNKDVATVVAGKVMAVSHGTATITASYDGITSNNEIKVDVNIEARTINFDPTTIILESGSGVVGEVKLDIKPSGADQTVVWAEAHEFKDATKKGKIFDKDNAELAIAVFEYDSANQAIKISPNLLDATRTGTLVVYNANGGSGAVSATLGVTVTAVAVTRVTISPSNDPYYLGVKSTLAVTAMVEPANATDKTVTWSDYDATANPPGRIKKSDGATIATYTIGEDKKLTVIGTAPGSGKLTVITTNKVHKAELNIRVATITISHSNGMETSVTLSEVGENASTLQFSAVMVPNEDAEFVWKSSNTAFAIVEETTGLVRAVASGKTKITATYNGITSNEIEVFVPTITLETAISGQKDEMDWTPRKKYDNTNNTLTLRAVMEPKVAGATFTWSATLTDIGHAYSKTCPLVGAEETTHAAVTVSATDEAPEKGVVRLNGYRNSNCEFTTIITAKYNEITSNEFVIYLRWWW